MQTYTGVMYLLARPALFALPPEVSHAVTMGGLASYGRLPGPIRPLPGERVEKMGLTFANPVGLAAGLDKDGVAVLGLARLGFGYVEIGTVTPKPQPGNPKPRLFRVPDKEALINRMGFNNEGVDEMARRLERLRAGGRLGATLLGVNVGKNKATAEADAARDYVACIDSVYPYADYLTLNVSSPNTPGLRDLQSGSALLGLLDQVTARLATLATRHRRRVPLLLKIAPDLEEPELLQLAAAATQFAVDGLIATNTTIARPGMAGLELAAESGGLSGAPLAPLAQTTVRLLRRAVGADMCIVGVGGITCVDAYQAMRSAGADLAQIYSGLIYRGPGLVRSLVGAPGTNGGPLAVD